jgi:hypothetical protein
LDEVLEDIGFIRSKIDPCLYRMSGKYGSVFIVVYVDDMMIFAEKKQDLELIKIEIRNSLEVTEIENINRFLNIQIEQNGEAGGAIHQKKYIEDILKRFQMDQCKRMKTPLAAGEKLHLRSDTCGTMTETPYREAVGMLQYLASSTRPDIAFAASYLGQFAANSGPEHWTSARHVMRYLQGTNSMKININDKNEDISAFCDADWAGSSTDRRSYSGYIVFLGKTPVIWKSKKQSCISLSTQEAEYVAMGECTKELQWLENLLTESGLSSVQFSSVYTKRGKCGRHFNKGAWIHKDK